MVIGWLIAAIEPKEPQARTPVRKCLDIGRNQSNMAHVPCRCLLDVRPLKNYMTEPKYGRGLDGRSHTGINPSVPVGRIDWDKSISCRKRCNRCSAVNDIKSTTIGVD